MMYRNMSIDFDGKKYKEASAHQKDWGTKVITDLSLKGCEKVLDLGCGDGVLTSKIAALLPQGFVLGIDASQSMIDTAQEQRVSNLQFQHSDINKIEFENEFDVVFSNAALHWVKDHNRLMQNVHKALRPEGILRFNFAGDGNCVNFFRVIKEVMGLPEYRDDFKGFVWPWYMPTSKDYEILVRDSRFREFKVWEENADRYFMTASQMVNWIDQPSIVPFLNYIKDTRRQEFRNIVVEKMLIDTNQNDGTYFEAFRRVNVFAKK